MEELGNEIRLSMQKTIDNLKGQFNTLRTGRANASILDRIEVDYYGTKSPINHLASVAVPEPQQLLIKPYDKNDIKAIISALGASDLGLNPINEGNQIRLVFPVPTEERRRDLVKNAKKYSEDAKVAIRNIRRDFMDLVKSDDTISEDYQKRQEEKIQEVTDEFIKMCDNLCKEKENEIMTI